MSDYFLSAKIIGDKELKDAFRTAPKIVAQNFSDAISKAGFEVERRAKQYAPWQHGDLRRSIHMQGPYVTADNIFAKVGSDKNYAIYQEKGTGIEGPEHRMIVPKTKKLLAWKSGGRWVFAKAVKGVKPKWYFKRAKEETQPLVTDYFRIAIGKILSALTKI
jgi:hypothetical protein